MWTLCCKDKIDESLEVVDDQVGLDGGVGLVLYTGPNIFIIKKEKIERNKTATRR